MRRTAKLHQRLTLKTLSSAVSVLALAMQLCACNSGKPMDTSDTQVSSQQLHTPKHAALHEQTLILIRNSDDAVPPRPKVYPVHAVYNREAIIPPMCYTRTEGKHNPCYVCHQNAIPDRENMMNDKNLQTAYSFSDAGLKNHWYNLFEDRSKHVNKMSDREILDWVNQDNYSELASRLRHRNFKGYIPDLKNLQEGAAAFNHEGFAIDGSHWVAFNYKPFPSTFWPTNGSTDDVMIRLPEPYRNTKAGKYSHDVYKANLAIVEANIKGVNRINTLTIDEKEINKDLNEDGSLSKINTITDTTAYVGAATGYFKQSFTYPKDTEFLHTVRYLGIEHNEITYSRRMKEVRYMKKWAAYPKYVLAQYYLEEEFEKEAGNLPGYTYLYDHGLDNGMGWSVQGFIENKNGRLRVASFEENLFCMGCHNSIGSTIDKTFSFGRKMDGAQGWGYINLKGMPDAPNIGENQGEIATYFERVGGGDEFRSNPEMMERWFDKNGNVDIAKMKNKDVYTLITPSVERALQLNKAYKVIVQTQDFLFGRDATVTPPKNIYETVNNNTSPTLSPEFQYDWNIRLDWTRTSPNAK
ncbi:MAG: hypothetical protein K6L76_02465 [Agarilytica sp.]